jgi:hypothetical protein
MGRERRCPMTERPGFLAMLQRIASNGVRLIRGQAREVRSGMPRGVAPPQFSIVKIRALWPLAGMALAIAAISHGLEAGKRPFHRSTRAANSHPRCR